MMLTRVHNKIRSDAQQARIVTRCLRNRDKIKAYWWNGAPNFGDLFTPNLLRQLTRAEAYNIRGARYDLGIAIVGAGSILESVGYPNFVVWGAGFIDDRLPPRAKPRKVLAYRGPKSEATGAKHGWPKSSTYGDPGLLASRFWKPNEKKYPFGIIPHYLHSGYFNRSQLPESVLLIDVSADFSSVLAQISSCERILSSSLHGLITAHSYQIPWCWLKLPTPLQTGDETFKFMDFFQSIGISHEPLVIDSQTALLRRLQQIEAYYVVPQEQKVVAIQNALLGAFASLDFSSKPGSMSVRV